MDGMRKRGSLVMIACLAVGCSRSLGQARLDDGKELLVEGHGSKTNLSVKCLTEAEIKQLTGSSIGPNIPKASCYTTVSVSSDSSSISRAITAYTRAETELNDKVATLITAGQSVAAATPGANLAKKLVTEEILKEDGAPQTGASALAPSLDPQTKNDVKATLKDIAAKTVDPRTRTKVNALLESVK